MYIYIYIYILPVGIFIGFNSISMSAKYRNINTKHIKENKINF